MKVSALETTKLSTIVVSRLVTTWVQTPLEVDFKATMAVLRTQPSSTIYRMVMKKMIPQYEARRSRNDKDFDHCRCHQTCDNFSWNSSRSRIQGDDGGLEDTTKVNILPYDIEEAVTKRWSSTPLYCLQEPWFSDLKSGNTIISISSSLGRRPPRIEYIDTNLATIDAIIYFD